MAPGREMSLSKETRDKLATVSVATICTAVPDSIRSAGRVAV